ncbi:hypothetical protein ABPG72_001082 [Tetrahymena utriculariae]
MAEQGGVYLKKQWFIKSNKGKIEDSYDIDPKKVLGSGTYGMVFKAKKKGTKITRAIKQIPKKKVKNQERFQREIEIMSSLDHPNIIKLYETFEDDKNIYLVMEVCEGGELFDRIIERGFFSEVDARTIFTQIMQAINYCHSKSISHRDLKPENFLFLTKHDDSPIKVIDFGLSKNFDHNQAMTTKAGTPYYISPEVLQGKYDESCDIWSGGVILYILLSGNPPFYGDTDPEILEAVKKGQFSFDIPEFSSVSQEAQDLIRKMITTPDKRLKSFEVLNHPWMKQDIKQKGKNLPLNFNALKNFTQHHKLKKVALTFIASQLSESEISDLGRLFRQLDKNGDGVLTIDEIKEGLSGTTEKSYEEIKKVIESIDTDGSGKIDYTEFLAATMEKSLYMKEDKLIQAFKMLDLDDNGKISKSELKSVLCKDEKYQNIPESYWDQMIQEVDKNGDGEIDYSEFREMMNTISLTK